MAETALTQVERLLQLIPLAARDGGIGYDDAARALGIDRRQLDRDLETLTTRDFYLPGGAVNDLQVTLDADRVHIWTTGVLRRPTRLTAGEAGAVDLGLRLVSLEGAEGLRPGGAAELEEGGEGGGRGDGGDQGVRAAARRLLEQVARTPPDPVLDRVAADGDPDAGDRLRTLLVDAGRRRRVVDIRYLKPDAPDADTRTVEPWAIAHAEGRWYVIGRDPAVDDVRVFRVDRILHATTGDETFSTPPDFDPSAFLADGRVYRADEEIEVVVRYSDRIAPWLVERGEGESVDDGGVLVRHRVADPGWVVRHVLAYGPEAEVVSPDSVRRLVREAVTGLASGSYSYSYSDGPEGGGVAEDGAGG